MWYLYLSVNVTRKTGLNLKSKEPNIITTTKFLWNAFAKVILGFLLHHGNNTPSSKLHPSGL